MPMASPKSDQMDLDVVNVILTHRLSKQKSKDETLNAADVFPPALIRKYSLHIKPLTKTKSLAVRQVTAKHIGSLIKVQGVITKVTEVKPLIVVAAYTCDKCGYEIYQEVTTDVFTPVPVCTSETCTKNQVKGQPLMQTRGSKFQKFQEVRIQELTDQVPMGHIPRSMTIRLTEDLTRTCNPGDHVVVSGTFLPTPFTGFKAIRAGLLTDTYLEACDIEQVKLKYSDMVVADSVGEQVIALSQDPEVYTKLSKSIAPEIFGHEDVKKALLLLMVGGDTRNLSDGMKIRGDINICLMGDPGVAKSQLLKYITKIAPRAVYTTGKGSSGVGLTASVAKDPISNEMILEGGALVLADNGICCIDEFDKMDEIDRTAIHEVMEQQTISISKAGITTTLNARTSILAAANPLHGRYNVKKSTKDNINLPHALLSRFDIMFLILDRANLDDDTRLAEHVVFVHRTGEAPSLDFDPITPEVFRNYIAKAKTFSPTVPKDLSQYIVGTYVTMRANDLTGKDTYTTARSLLAILRLSQALCKLRFNSVVSRGDVDEAIRLLDASKASVYCSDQVQEKSQDPITRIYTLILEIPGVDQGSDKEIPMDQIRQKIRSRGFSDQQLAECIDEFEKCNIWTKNASGTHLRIIN